ncbi:Flagellar biosynthetic protein FlhB [Pseudidiomarina piscicola]|uniref:Flagellar biosynthetic protein FlhB n=1 Tax=Pseudidiomarina piscicola TaxID=2614830 RepID=A0A6S6WPB7_9GAMM|nr:flagellar biosynthesis protein FlhB [Pseudidiomarina piscicola]CAB0151069.1 Flagellar biosynthetic protein FlhB [Pseudidiomarina piscicola]VZT40577.1 Flagellar biosynthetic protein FlhB [Pseudomonas aeruginosa]
MAEDSSSDQEKTEDPTARRIQKSRDEGQVARSRELTTFVMLLGGVALLWLMSSPLFYSLGSIMEQSFVFDRQRVTDTGPMLQAVLSLGERALWAILPMFAVLLVLALVAPALLGGWVMSAKSLQPKFEKLNPIKGVKRIFSTQALAELGKAIAKTVLVGGVLCLFLWAERFSFMELLRQPVREALMGALELAATACLLMALTLIVVALFDVPFQLMTHTKKLRMTKDEVKRENKETDGDPQIKAKIRQQQQAMAKQRMMNDVPTADVIVTNPSHYAVALKYDDSNMGAPRVVAKGVELIAEKIKSLGSEHRVPQLEAPPLARALNKHVDIGHEIPVELYSAVAEVLAWAFQVKKFSAGEAPQPPQPTTIDIPQDYEVAPS